MATGANGLKLCLLLLLILILIGILFESKTNSIDIRLYLKEYVDSEHSGDQLHPFSEAPQIAKSRIKTRYLSYQPPGNGWNNQRIALENALVLAKLLNRTLLVHPMAPHEKGNKLKVGRLLGYEVYNMLKAPDLLPLSEFLDLELLSRVVSVKEVITSHPDFVREFSHLTWRNVCHSPGNGFWVDQLPQTESQEKLLARQKFSSLGKIWRDRCLEEDKRVRPSNNYGPIIRYVSEFAEEDSELLYFERGTLFGMQIRFTTIERAREAQAWVIKHVRYSKAVWNTVHRIAETIGPQYNAIQVRRKDHMDSKLPQSFWIDKMIKKAYHRNVSVYVATNDANRKWFKPFEEMNYKLVFSKNLTILSFPRINKPLRNDFLAIHEQCICEQAVKFVGSPASTFSALILRLRGEVRIRNGMMMDTLHSYWIGHKLKRTRTQLS